MNVSAMSPISDWDAAFGPLAVAACAPAIIDRALFLSAMGKAATGVQVVSTDGPCGRYAMTVSAVCSVSADPPLVLACINQRSPACKAITGNNAFCINFLSAEQALVSDTFAGRGNGTKPFDFECAEWATSESGSSRLLGAAAAVDCKLAASLKAGSHIVFFGYVIAAAYSDATPLVYSRGRYGRFDPSLG